jgi:hypothetical protein
MQDGVLKQNGLRNHDEHGYETENPYREIYGRNQWLMPFIGLTGGIENVGINEIEKISLDNQILRLSCRS